MIYCSEYVSRKIKVLSFLGMITVICIHSNPLSLTIDPSNFAKRFSDILESLQLWAVPFFFLVSGFFFQRNMELNDWRKLFKRKLFSLIIPYLIWGGVYGGISMIPLQICVNRMHGKMMFSDTLFQSSSWVHFLDNLWGVASPAPINGALWYVRALILFFLLTPIWLCIIKKGSFLLPIIGLPLAFLIGVQGRNHHLLFSVGNFGFYFSIGVIGFLFLGMWIGKLRIEELRVSPYIMFATATFIICGIVLLPCNCIIAPFLVIFVWGAYDLIPIRFKSPLPFVFSLSFWVYCMHHPLTGWVGAILRRILGRTEMSFYVQLVLIPCISLVISIGTAIFFKKLFPRIFYVLSGGR